MTIKEKFKNHLMEVDATFLIPLNGIKNLSTKIMSFMNYSG